MFASKLIAIKIITGILLFTNSIPEDSASTSGATSIESYSFEEDDDRDYDGFPDGWTKRKGDNYPAYNKVFIDHEIGSDDSRQSLCFELKRDEITAYSPVRIIDAPHSYLVTGKIKTQGLINSAAVVSISFLDSERVLVKSKTSKYYTGTFNTWQDFIVEAMNPPQNAKYAVIACHLVQGKNKDIRGKVWFDEIQLKQKPRFNITSDFDTHFVEYNKNKNISINWKVRGLDPGYHVDEKNNYVLKLQLFAYNHFPGLEEDFFPENSDEPNGKPAGGKVGLIMEETRKLIPDVIYHENGETESIYRPENHVPWEIPAQDYGFYKVKATLLNNGKQLPGETTNFIVMDRVKEVHQKNGEFGWSVSQPISEFDNDTLDYSVMEKIIKQSGIHWLQYPVWQSVLFPEESQKLSAFFEKISHLNVKSVGVLASPPDELRSKFASDWDGVSEIFSMYPEFWSGDVEKAVARYSSSIRHWQLGSNHDESFIGLNTLNSIMSNVHSEFSRIGRDTRLGMRWDWESQYPSHVKNSKTFLITESTYPDTYQILYDKLNERKKLSNLEKNWVIIRPMSQKEAAEKISLSEIIEEELITGSDEVIETDSIQVHNKQLIRTERSSDLIKRMVAAKQSEADVILAYDVFDRNYGILNKNGSPGDLYLPWRTAALTLSGAKPGGSFQLKERSNNFVFFKENEAVVVMWNDEATRTEKINENIFLGANAESVKNSWNSEFQLNKSDGLDPHKLEVGPDPLIIKNCSPELAKWRLAIHFKNGQVASKSGNQVDEIKGFNPFKQQVSVKVNKIVSQSGWKITLLNNNEFTVDALSSFRIPIGIKLGADTSIGDEELEIPFQISADRTYNIVVPRIYKIGSDDISIAVKETRREDNTLQIEQIITNDTNEFMSFKCMLFIPGQVPQKRRVIRLRKNYDSKFYILPDADSLKGKELTIKATQMRGDYVLNYKWKVGETWDSNARARKRKAKLLEDRIIREAIKQKENGSQARRPLHEIRSALLRNDQSSKQ